MVCIFFAFDGFERVKRNGRPHGHKVKASKMADVIYLECRR